MIEVLQHIFAGLVLLVMGWVAYMSCVLVSEKKERYRAGTHDYYDNPIKPEDRKCLGGEDDFTRR